MDKQVSKSLNTKPKDSNNKDTAYKWGFELTKKEKREYELQVELVNT